MSLSPQSINDYRRRILAGEEISEEELALAVRSVISSRTTAVVEKAEAKAKKNEQLDLASLFSSLPAKPKEE